MELIQNNPYRISGILSNASERELQRQRGKIKAYSKVGKEIKSDFDFQILRNISRTEDSIDKAFSTIEQNQDKVNFALFWFLNASPFDTAAFEYLKNGNEEKAVEIWGKVTINKEVNSKNFSAFNNLGTYKLLSQTQNDIKVGIEAKIKLIESDFFENFVHSVADETFTIDNEKQIEKMVDELLTQFKNQYSSSETLQLFSGCNGTTQKYLSKKFTEEPIHKIESQIESTKKKRKENKSSAYKFGLNLDKECTDDLILLRSLLSVNDLKYKSIADQLANEIMQCGIDYFNESQENGSNENYLESSQKLTKLADSIAVGKFTKDRVKDSLATLAEMKDREIGNAIALLQSIKEAYESNKAKIEAQVRAMPLYYNQTINWTKVNKKIEESIDWDKVVDMVLEAIPKSNVDKIRQVSETSRLEKYKSLVDFLISKLGFSQTNKVKYLTYWKTEYALSNAQLTAKSLPIWAKWVGGIAVLLLLVGLIWGEEGLKVVFGISAFLGVMFLIGWLRNL